MASRFPELAYDLVPNQVDRPSPQDYTANRAVDRTTNRAVDRTLDRAAEEQVVIPDWVSNEMVAVMELFRIRYRIINVTVTVLR